ncbi:hypothetical protein PG984_002696 [Apiospora sp. TS-2023a]
MGLAICSRPDRLATQDRRGSPGRDVRGIHQHPATSTSRRRGYGCDAGKRPEVQTRPSRYGNSGYEEMTISRVGCTIDRPVMGSGMTAFYAHPTEAPAPPGRLHDSSVPGSQRRGLLRSVHS